MTNLEIENRINKLKNNPVRNEKIIKKLLRKLKNNA